MLLAFDIGGTKVACARVEGGVIRERRQYPMAYEPAGFAEVIDQLTAGWAAPSRVAVCTTGYIDGGRVHSVNLDIIRFWDGFALAEMLQARFACPVDLINDGQAAGWGEYVARRARGLAPANLLFMTLSTGVGGGLVLDHRLRRGPHGLAAHVGHAGVRLMALDGVTACGCGRSGCLEMIASGTALARQAGALFGRPVSSAELFALAATELRAERIIVHAAQAVAEAIAGFHMIVDLQEVVIGGSVGLASGMLERIRAALHDMPLRAAPLLSAACQGGDAGLTGVIALDNERQEK
ncbi:ROK family protein [Duganella qianjiadongensis]|uniref:ROK family protein n=1 Tax=Duganella qianjiadongensis TaxID=2692176 RepID=A0ABW9VEE7_9BURK|nr:ROK family protein [Duganella qianjiadongensis]MYM37931.1 ROK family protein [Duganella qianjiadongensis]